MAKVKTNSLKKKICDNCHGNGYVRVAVGNTSIDFRDNSQVHQCWVCDSEGEVYEEGLILLMTILFLTSCTKVEFDSFNPATSTFKWVISNERN